MANLLIPWQSFEFEDEIKQSKEIPARYSHLLKQIDDTILITIIGRKNKDLWEDQVITPLRSGKILEPKFDRPIEPSLELTHIAVVLAKSVQGKPGYLYGNVGALLDDFVRAVILKALARFPKRLDLYPAGY
ncbi:MAG TPA: hypothetical protein VNN20_12005 [Thermodesulfobacteriota bacterium]|nr:hypothetical protein [Thermodesulfobacteriota bacterium]